MLESKSPKSITSIDVARLAGVSQSTVSRAFSAGSSLADKTKQKVFQAAKTLGYQPNAIAQSLVSARSNLIGIVKGYTVSPVYDEMLSEFTYLIQSMGKQVLYFEGRRYQDIDEVFLSVLKYQIEGLILLFAKPSFEITVRCQQRNIPVLEMLRHSTNTRANMVVADNDQAVRDAVDHLHARGYHSFAYITGDLDSSSNAERQLAYIAKMQELSITAPIIVEGDYTYEAGRAAAARVAQKSSRPCGVIAASDMIGLGVMDGLRYDHGLKVPEDFGVIGFDDISMAGWPTYSLTTMRQPTKEMVRDGLAILCQNIENRDISPLTRKYPLHLVQRGST